MARKKTSQKSSNKTVDYHPVRPQLRRHTSGQARVTLSGKTYYLGRYDSIEAQERYLELVKRWEANGRKRLEPAKTVVELEAAERPQKAPTVREVFGQYERYLDETGRYQKHGKPTSERAMVQLAIRELLQLFGDLPATELGEAQLLAYRDTLERCPRITRKGINRKLQLLKRGLKWMRPRGLINRDQWHEIHALEPIKRGEMQADRERRQNKRAVTFAEVQVVAAEAGHVVGAMMRLQALTGMRPGEVCAMKWEDIDRTPVRIEDAVCWTYRVREAKTAHHGHETVYPLTPAAQELLQDFDDGSTSYVFSPQRAMQERREDLRARRTTPATQQTRDRDARARRRYRENYTVETYGKAVNRAVERTTVRRFTPHEIRHGFVTRAARAYGVLAASAAANHKNVSTTQGYLHADREDAYRVAVGLGHDTRTKHAVRGSDSA